VSKLTNLISALKRASGEVITEVSALDKWMQENRRRREAFLAERVCKEDFVSYIRRTMELKGKPFEQKLQRMVAGQDLTLGRLELAVNFSGGVGLPFLTGDAYIPTPIEEDAVFYYFGDLITQRIADAVDSLDWPKGVMPAAERLKLIDKLDAEYADLMGQRLAIEDQVKLKKPEYPERPP